MGAVFGVLGQKIEARKSRIAIGGVLIVGDRDGPDLKEIQIKKIWEKEKSFYLKTKLGKPRVRAVFVLLFLFLWWWGNEQTQITSKNKILLLVRIPGTYVYQYTSGCLLYTSPSPRDRG